MSGKPYIEQTDLDEIIVRKTEQYAEKLRVALPLTFVMDYMLELGYPNGIIHTSLHRQYPDCKTSLPSIQVRRNHLRQMNPTIPTSTAAHVAFREGRAEREKRRAATTTKTGKKK